MKKALALVTSVLLVAACGQEGSGPVKVGGYVKDVTTNQNLKGYTMTVETAHGKRDVSIDKETGKFSFSVSPAADYVVNVKMGDFRDFTSTQKVPLLNTEKYEVYQTPSYLFQVPMVPKAITSPAVNVKVKDRADSSAKVDSGFYRLTGQGLHPVDSEKGVSWLLPDAPVVTGTIKNGSFTLTEGSVVPGAVYQLTIFGGSTYKQKTVSFAPTEGDDGAQKFEVSLDRVNQ